MTSPTSRDPAATAPAVAADGADEPVAGGRAPAAINETELRKLDLNLLLTFSALMRERSATRAAARLYVGQSAVSMALRKLRTAFDDELFVRVGRELRPTARAEAVFAELAPALERIQTTLDRVRPFEPATSTAHFTLGTLDDIEMALLPHLVRDLGERAPELGMTVRRADYRTAVDLLEGGLIDVGVSQFGEVPKWVRKERLGEARFSVMYDGEGTGLGRTLSLDEYTARQHVLVSLSGKHGGVVDEALATVGRTRRIAFVVPHFASVPHVLRGTPYLVTLPDHVADRFEVEFGFARVRPPVEPRAMQFHMIWNRALDDDPRQAWFREALRRAWRAIDWPAYMIGPPRPSDGADDP